MIERNFLIGLLKRTEAHCGENRDEHINQYIPLAYKPKYTIKIHCPFWHYLALDIRTTSICFQYGRRRILHFLFSLFFRSLLILDNFCSLNSLPSSLSSIVLRDSGLFCGMKGEDNGQLICRIKIRLIFAKVTEF